MSKVKTAVLELLSDGKWHTTPEILDSVTKSCCTNRGNVIKVIHTLSGGHHIIKQHADGDNNFCRYKQIDFGGGFGLSLNMAMFNGLLAKVRGAHENHAIHS
ncbi:hypothetical protein SAMN03097719_3234 [Pantoea ananatis]|uniref:hypothetical protein n=1 Tax=Pantoea ananas TaxID=553 RepID=UPI00099BDC3C|nr:hypothetical protein [Pantoea ananatis]SKA79409.1 hypothetical protein SAMN03097719_3234 [Pantoea ananatis]